MKDEKINAVPILFAVFLISICGIIYELIIGAISSYLLGDSVKQYSITIGLFMSAMGVGSSLSKKIKTHLFDKFILIELSIGIIGGLSAIILFAAYGYTKIYYFVMYLIIILIGSLVGLEIPIITRIIEESNQELRITLANVLSFDYLGGLLGSIAFPLLLLPHLGEVRTSFLVGFINIVVAIGLLYYYKDYIKKLKFIKSLAFIYLVIIVIGFVSGDYISHGIENSFYRDRIIYSQQTPYQKIVVTKHRDDLRLYLNGNIQFSSLDEHRYHEALVHPAMSLAKNKKDILILGGGDGLAAREILKYSEVETITLVDLDPDIVEFCKNDPLIKKLNQNALMNEKLMIRNEDAYKFLENAYDMYDVILVDLPDPNNESLNKLYTNLFYRLIYLHLNEGGMVAIQSTSPYYAKEAYWCIRKTVDSEGFITSGYHLNIPSFGDWGFTLASNKAFDEKDIQIDVDTKYLNSQVLQSLFQFAKDETVDLHSIKINSLTNAALLEYYQHAWANY